MVNVKNQTDMEEISLYTNVTSSFQFLFLVYVILTFLGVVHHILFMFFKFEKGLLAYLMSL